MYTVLLATHVLLAIALVTLVLLQHGKGADAGAAFGSGASGTVFGSRGSSNFLSRSTAVLATLFFVTSLTLSYLVNGPGSGSVIDQLSQEPLSQVETAPETAPAPASAPEDVAPQVPDAAAEEADGGARTTAPADAGGSDSAGNTERPADVPSPASGGTDP